MNTDEHPSTLREVLGILAQKNVVFAYVITVVGCTIAGPFSTFDKLSLVERLPYWALVICGCFIIAISLRVMIYRFAMFSKFSEFLKSILLTGLIGLIIAVFIFYINLVLWGDIPQLPRFHHYLAMTMPISVAMSVIFHFVESQTQHQKVQTKNPIVFFERIPVHLGRELYSVSVSDHYIEAVTAKGAHMMLMRLGDAIRELDGLDGIQIHRSHWIATDAVEKTITKNGKLILTLKDRRSFTVSRSRAAAVKTHLNV